jgi:hypothetical protein
VRQTLVDDADERDFALTAVVDVKASDEAGRVVLTVLSITAA